MFLSFESREIRALFSLILSLRVQDWEIPYKGIITGEIEGEMGDDGRIQGFAKKIAKYS